MSVTVGKMRKCVFVLTIKEGNVVAVDGKQRVALLDEEAAFGMSFRGKGGLHAPAELLGIVGSLRFLRLFQRPPKVIFFYRLEQVVDAVELEGTDGILVVSRCEDCRHGDLYALEDIEANPVVELYVGYDEVDVLLLGEQLDTLLHARSPTCELHVRAQGTHHPAYLFVGKPFVLYDDIFLHGGKDTNNFSESGMNGGI